MIINEFKELFERDFDRLHTEINSYSSQETLWKTEGSVSNSSGNLCLHLLGNLQSYIGKEIGGFEYERNREREFSAKGISKEDLLNEILFTKDIVSKSLEGMDDSLWPRIYPLQIFGKPMTYGYFLTHLYGHLNYHLGQINYHRRLIDL